MAPSISKTMTEQLGHLLLMNNLILATAESCTGGGLAEMITRVPGSSAWFERGFVTYSNNAKQEMLGSTKSRNSAPPQNSRSPRPSLKSRPRAHAPRDAALGRPARSGPGLTSRPATRRARRRPF